MAIKGPILDWEKLYEENDVEEMPWFHEGLDPDVVAALDRLGIERGTALDLGTGPGTQAIALARRGLRVTATDISPTAIEKARARANAEGLEIDFVVDDVLHSRLKEAFDLVFDRGCFHVLKPEQREDYVHAVHGRLRPGGYLFLKTFSVRETREEGPHRFSPPEIEQIFRPRFAVQSIVESVFHGTLESFPKALFCILQPV